MPVSSQTLYRNTGETKGATLTNAKNVTRVESVQKVNYEGKLAYQINTDRNTLYLNAMTADVLAMTPRLDSKPKTVQISYEPPRYQQHEEHEDMKPC